MLFYLQKSQGKFSFNKCNVMRNFENRVAKQTYKSFKTKKLRLIRRKLIKTQVFKDFSEWLSLCLQMDLNVYA